MSNLISNCGFDSIDVFSYTNETLSAFLGSLRNIKVRVLARDYLIEKKEQKKYNDKFNKKEASVDPKKKPWLKHADIKTHSGFINKIVSNQKDCLIDLRFYSQRPSIKGAILYNSKTGERTANFGFYHWLPGREEGGTPYIGSRGSGISLYDDHGPSLVIIDSVKEYFEELWSNSRTYNDMIVEEDLLKIEEQKKQSIISIWESEKESNFTVVLPGRKIENRQTPAIANLDLDSFRLIEQALNSSNCSVELNPVKYSEPLGSNSEIDNIIKSAENHLILICTRTINKFLYGLMKNINFPFAVEFDKNKRLCIKDIENPTVIIKSPEPEENKLNTDYCLITKFDNPIKGKTNKIFIIAGIRAMGTFAGSQYLTEGGELLSLCKLVGRDNFAGMIKCQYEFPNKLLSIRPYLAPVNFTCKATACII
jgi:hypothetical protein